MCKEAERAMRDEESSRYTTGRDNQLKQATESHMVYELKQQREHLFKMLVDVQKAIDAINAVR